jgi:hypothetical protein
LSSIAPKAFGATEDRRDKSLDLFESSTGSFQALSSSKPHSPALRAVNPAKAAQIVWFMPPSGG